MPRRFPAWRLASFIAGIATLLVAIASPLEALDDLLLQVHMTQHLILMMRRAGAPARRSAGDPARCAAYRRASPRPSSAARSARGPVRRAFDWLTQPLVCWIAFVAATWFWHIPATFQLALRSDGWHVVEHACFFTTASDVLVPGHPAVAEPPRDGRDGR